MLLGIDPLLSPDLLHALASAGHGDKVAIVDANFPAASHAQRLVLMPGANATAVLLAILSVLPVDTFEPDPVLVMEVVGQPDAIPEAVADFTRVLANVRIGPPARLQRHVFYRVAKDAFAIVQTTDRRLYGNIILTKGVVR